MRLLAIVMLGGCWPSTALRDGAPPARCEIHDREITPIAALPLLIRGKHVANIEEPIERLDVVVDHGVARMHVESSTAVLDGELDLLHTSVRPRDVRLHDGWLELRDARVREVRDAVVRAEAVLPAGWQPASVPVALRCETVTFGAAPEYQAPDTAELIELVPGRAIPVARTRARHDVVATVRGKVPEDDVHERAGYALENRDGWVRVRLDAPDPVVGWIEQGVVKELGYGGLVGNETCCTMMEQVHCMHDVPVFVTVGNEPLQIGHMKPKVGFWTGDDLGEGQINVLDRDGPLRPFVRRADITDCRWY